MGRKNKREKGSVPERKDYSALLLELQVNRERTNEYRKRRKRDVQKMVWFSFRWEKMEVKEWFTRDLWEMRIWWIW